MDAEAQWKLQWPAVRCGGVRQFSSALSAWAKGIDAANTLGWIGPFSATNVHSQIINTNFAEKCHTVSSVVSPSQWKGRQRSWFPGMSGFLGSLCKLLKMKKGDCQKQRDRRKISSSFLLALQTQLVGSETRRSPPLSNVTNDSGKRKGWGWVKWIGFQRVPHFIRKRILATLKRKHQQSIASDLMFYEVTLYLLILAKVRLQENQLRSSALIYTKLNIIHGRLHVNHYQKNYRKLNNDSHYMIRRI